RALADEELALARRWGDPHTVGASLRVLGLVEGGEAAIGLLREAVEVLAGSGARLEHARALVDLGAALRRANQRAEARERLPGGGGPAPRTGRLGRERPARRAARGVGDEQQGDRATALRHDQDGRGASEPRLSQARDRLPRTA